MDPQKIRAALQIAAGVLTMLTALVVQLQSIDFTSTTAAIGGIAMAVGLAIGKASEAPGGVPKWKIPEHLQKFIPK